MGVKGQWGIMFWFSRVQNESPSQSMAWTSRCSVAHCSAVSAGIVRTARSFMCLIELECSGWLLHCLVPQLRLLFHLGAGPESLSLWALHMASFSFITACPSLSSLTSHLAPGFSTEHKSRSWSLSQWVGAEISECCLYTFCGSGQRRFRMRGNIPIKECMDTYLIHHNLPSGHKLFTFLRRWNTLTHSPNAQQSHPITSHSDSNTRISFVKSCVGRDEVCWVWFLRCWDLGTKRASYLVPLLQYKMGK